MSSGRFAAALLLLAGSAWAGAINTDSALIAGRGQLVSRTRLRYEDAGPAVERYLAQQTVVYGVTHKLSVLATLGYEWRSPGDDGLTDLALRARIKLFARDARRETLSFAALLGMEVPIGEEPVASPDGGVIAGVTGTWEKGGWRVDADFVNAFRPNAPDRRQADVALVRVIHETDQVLWMGVLELNYRRNGANDVLFLAPGLVHEVWGWKAEVSVQINVADDARNPVPDYAVVFALFHVF